MLIGHGGDVYSAARAVGLSPHEILDFSSNVSPLPFKASFVEHIKGAILQIRHLPEPDSLGVRKRLSLRYRRSEDAFLVGAGTTQWIFDIPKIFDCRRAVIPTPTYADYEDAARLACLEPVFLGPFIGNPEEMKNALMASLRQEVRAQDLVFLCNPNNPTGIFIEPKTLIEIIHERPGAMWIIDESYAPFVDDDTTSSLLFQEVLDNLLILRSFSKIYGIPGLRVGILVGSKDTAGRLRAIERPWAVDRIAQVAAEYLIDQRDIEEEARSLLKREKRHLINALRDSTPVEVLKGETHFFMIRLPAGMDSAEVKDRLLKKGILIRDCSNIRGIPKGRYIRISPRLEEENQRFIEEFKALF